MKFCVILFVALTAIGLASTSASAQSISEGTTGASFHPSTPNDFLILNDGSSTYNADTAGAHWASGAKWIYSQAVSMARTFNTTVYLHNNGQTTACYYIATDVNSGNAWTGSNSTAVNGFVQLPLTVTAPAPIYSSTYLSVMIICSLPPVTGSNYAAIYGTL